MPDINLGALRFVFRGVYDAGTAYAFNDVTRYQGDLYVYVQSYASTGVVPTDTTRWTLMAPIAGAVTSAGTAASATALMNMGG